MENPDDSMQDILKKYRGNQHAAMAGDDLLTLFKTAEARNKHVADMDRLTSPVNTLSTRGLGLIAKTPSQNYKRGNMLSKDIGLVND